MSDLFLTEPIYFNLPDAEIIYVPNFYKKEEADRIFSELQQSIPWQQDDIMVFGKTYPQPRLTALFGDEGKSYGYSNLIMQPHPWNELLQNLKLKVEDFSKDDFTTVLLNYYRNGQDSNGWHADNEKELGKNPVIASLSFGESRCFQLKHSALLNLKQNIVLQHGSLLLMKGTTQHFWKHQIPKTSKTINPRINLTFRKIY